MFRRLLPVWALMLSCLVGCPSAPAPEKKVEGEVAPAVTATPDDAAVIQTLKDAGAQIQLNKDQQVVAVDLVDVSMEDAAKATELLTEIARLPEVEVLRISGPGVSNETFKLVAGLKKIRVLELRNTKVNDEGAAIVAGFSNLTNLLARRTDFTSAALDSLSALKNLRQLDLRFTNMSDAGMADLNKKFPNLTSLKLEGSKVTSKGVEPISQCTKLTELNLWGGTAGERQPRALAGADLYRDHPCTAAVACDRQFCGAGHCAGAACGPVVRTWVAPRPSVCERWMARHG